MKKKFDEAREKDKLEKFKETINKDVKNKLENNQETESDNNIKDNNNNIQNTVKLPSYSKVVPFFKSPACIVGMFLSPFLPNICSLTFYILIYFLFFFKTLISTYI